MRYLAIVAVVLFVGACGEESPAGPGTPGAAGTGQAMSGGAGTGGMCVDRPECGLGPDQLALSLTTGNKPFESPTCPGRRCAECAARNKSNMLDHVRDCFMHDADGGVVYCDNSAGVGGSYVAGTDCN